MHEVDSSMISGVDADGEDLLVRFRNTGKTFRYRGQANHMGPLKAAAADKGGSCGKYFHQHLRSQPCEACEE